MSLCGLRVDLQQVDLDRGGRAVLRDINWTIEPGQRWALTGANGAGKTQLLKLVSGALWPTPTGRERRSYWLAGERHDSPAVVLDEIAYVGAERQDRYERYDWNFTVAAVVGTGLYRTDIPLDRLSAADRHRIDQVLGELGIAALARRRFLTLSYGERRLVLLARVLAARPKLLLLDEAANGLDAENHARWLRWLESTDRTPLSWVLGTHHANDIPACITHSLSLEGGRIVSQQRASATTVRRALRHSEQPRRRVQGAHRKTRSRGQLHPRAALVPIVSLQNASVYLDGHRALVDVSMAVRPGEFWVVTGRNGSGKTTLLRTLYGDHGVAAGGKIERRGIAVGVSLEHFKRRVAYVAPHLQAEQPRALPVLEAVASGRHASVGLNEALSGVDRTAAQRALRQFGARQLATRPLVELSYGQLRRVLFARAWVDEPCIALLDEPFAGLDPATRADLLERTQQFVVAGGACVLATHNPGDTPRSGVGIIRIRAGRVRLEC
ncbi:MAG: ATP-binding cassette domain-containing protein [Steroidobacteraceae bacterium]